MGTTRIQVDSETHARLVELSKSTGASLMATVREAVEALSRQRFGFKVVDEMAELRSDSRGWSAYQSEADTTDVGDGLEMLARPHFNDLELEAGYHATAADEAREALAGEWAEDTLGDVADEPR